MRLRDLQLGKEAHKVISFSRMTEQGPVGVDVAIVPLTAGEVIDSRATASMSADAALLARALRDPEQPSEPWASEKEIVDLLTPREIAMLLTDVARHQQQVSPPLSSMSAKSFEKVLDDIEGESSDLLIGFRAKRARELFAYYGEPASKLTDGQVLYFLGLLRADAKRSDEYRKNNLPEERR